MASRTRLIIAAALSLLAAQAVNAQDLDTLAFSDSRKPFTFLDQIDDVEERRFFRRLHAIRDARDRLRLADEFLTRFPQSWLLAFVHEIAAKAASDTGDDASALEHSRHSLRLYPENPLLLIPLARIELKKDRFAEAAAAAEEGLQVMKRFGRPSTVAAADWVQMQRDLTASAHYVAGRALLTLALERRHDPGLRTRAARHLQKGAAADPKNTEITELLKLFTKLPAAEASIGKSMLARQPGYAGSQSCNGCHGAEHSAWRQTGMARMLQPYDPARVIGDFAMEAPTTAVKPVLDHGRHSFDLRTGSRVQRFPVTHLIGSKWQQAYATRDPQGRLHVFPIQFNVLEKVWLNYWKVIDPPNSPRADPDNFHRFDTATDYMVNCAPCHTSQLRGPTTDAMRFREEGVNCEQCHGPSADHVQAMRDGKRLAKQPIEPPVDFRRISASDSVAICAQCHAQSRLNELGANGEVNFRETGERFFARYPSRPLVEFSRRAFYKDGRFRETTFIAEAFLRTKCFKKGQATCNHCHDPHPPDAARNPASLKYLNSPDQMCTQCHRPHATAHAKNEKVSACVDCHMPKIMNSVMFAARSHQIDDIPDARMTARFGQQESPNACLMCHKDRDPSWLLKR